MAVTPHGDEPESSVGEFSGGNFKVGTLEDLLRRCNPDKKYIGNSTKGNEILPSWTVSSYNMGELGTGDTRPSGNAEKVVPLWRQRVNKCQSSIRRWIQGFVYGSACSDLLMKSSQDAA